MLLKGNETFYRSGERRDVGVVLSPNPYDWARLSTIGVEYEALAI